MEFYSKEDNSRVVKEYVVPTITITIIMPTDIITGSPEVGGEWPWGNAEGYNFG